MRELNKKEIAKEFTRQMLDPNTPSINFEQVTTMLAEIQQTHKGVLSNMDSYRIRERVMDSTLSVRHSQVESLKQQLNQLSEQLTESSKRLSKFRTSSLWQRYWTAIAVGLVSAVLTNLVWWIKMG